MILSECRSSAIDTGHGIPKMSVAMQTIQDNQEPRAPLPLVCVAVDRAGARGSVLTGVTMNILSRLKAIRDCADHIATWTERDGLDRTRLASIANHSEVVAQDFAGLLAACNAVVAQADHPTQADPAHIRKKVEVLRAAIALAEGGQA